MTTTRLWPAFEGQADVVTYEFENVPLAAAEALASNVPDASRRRALAVSQDRLTEKTFLNRAGPVHSRLQGCG
jgi:5-(carboxyamino)imidazole ribonucleotide synthase